MQTRQRFVQLMQQFAQEIELDEPSLSEDGLICRLAFPDRDRIVTISCHPGEEALFFFTALDPIERPIESHRQLRGRALQLIGGCTHVY